MMVAYVITIASIIAVIVSENRNPVRSLAWITVLMLLPAVGIVLYIFFGRSFKSKRSIVRRIRKYIHANETGTVVPLSDLCLTEQSKTAIALGYSLNDAEYYEKNEIEIFNNGKDKFDALKRDLLSATKYINLQYYIFENDTIGNEIKSILISKAQSGVKVRVIYDDVGSWDVKRSFFSEMVANGVDARPFLKVAFPPFATKINLRNHRKIVVIDGRVGYIGGMNIADRYVQGNHLGQWRDVHLRIKGAAVKALQGSFANDWHFMGRPALTSTIHAEKSAGEAGVQLMVSGPTGKWNNVSMMFLCAISQARKCVYVQTPYFLPTESLLEALQTVALAGVDVKIMIPRRSDSVMLRKASYSYVKECLEAGIKVYTYEAGMLHSKMLIVDDEIASVGSTNFDFRSFEHNFESNVFIYDKHTNSRLKKLFNEDVKSSTKLTMEQWSKRPLFERFGDSLVRLLSPVL